MTTKRMLVAILIATIFQFVAEAAWFLGFAKSIVNAEMSCIMRVNPYVPLNFFSEMALSVLIVLAINYYPKYVSKKMGLLIGLCIGLLVSLNQQIDWFANWTMSPLLFFLETFKNTALGIGVGLIAALMGGKKVKNQQRIAYYSAA